MITLITVITLFFEKCCQNVATRCRTASAWEAWDRSPRPRTARDPHIMSLSTAASLSQALGVSLDEFWHGLD